MGTNVAPMFSASSCVTAQTSEPLSTRMTCSGQWRVLSGFIRDTPLSGQGLVTKAAFQSTSSRCDATFLPAPASCSARLSAMPSGAEDLSSSTVMACRMSSYSVAEL